MTYLSNVLLIFGKTLLSSQIEQKIFTLFVAIKIIHRNSMSIFTNRDRVTWVRVFSDFYLIGDNQII